MMDVSDSKLVERAQSGDVAAFAHLVERHEPGVRAGAFSVTLRSDLADDAAQEAFLLAWQKLAELRSTDSFGSWVSGIARNLGKKAVRARDREVYGGDLEAVLSEVGNPEDAARNQQYRLLLEQGLSCQSTDELETLALFYGEGGSIRAVAEALGISKVAAQKRVSRARQGLSDEVQSALAGGARRHRNTAAVVAAVVALLPAGATAAPLTSSIATSSKSKGAVAMMMLKLVGATGVLMAVGGLLVVAAARERARPSGLSRASAHLGNPVLQKSRHYVSRSRPALPGSVHSGGAPTRGTLAVEVVIDGRPSPRVVHFLFPGHHEPEPPPLDAWPDTHVNLAGQYQGSKFGFHGGAHSANFEPYTWDELEPGSYTTCIDVGNYARYGRPRRDYFECRKLTIAVGLNLESFEIALERTGSVLRIEPSMADDPDSIAAYTLIPGHHRPDAPSIDDYRRRAFELAKRYEGAEVELRAYEDPVEWTGLEPGNYTVCADVGDFVKARRTGFTCRHVELGVEPITIAMALKDAN
ncbi:MAG: sigma-70 family RNA polymerase sigma factor [Deltaproteobacteria bacterium]|nr:sigma-70 family RNA polymerase sigma factor [Deltaproteobacteria bacterium]